MKRHSHSDNETTAGKFVWQVNICSASHLDYWINDYFDGLTVCHEADGSSTLRGELPDMPAVYGLILKLRDTGIILISLQIKRIKQEDSKMKAR